MEQIRRKTLLQGDDSIYGNSSQIGLFSSLRNSKLLSQVTDVFGDQGEGKYIWTEYRCRIKYVIIFVIIIIFIFIFIFTIVIIIVIIVVIIIIMIITVVIIIIFYLLSVLL